MEVKHLIAFYKNILKEYCFVLTPSIQTLLEQTVKVLESIKEGGRASGTMPDTGSMPEVSERNENKNSPR